MSARPENRTIFCQDNLVIMRAMGDESVDLIYLDPPFNKNKEFFEPIGRAKEKVGFSDVFRKSDVKDEWLWQIKAKHRLLHGYLEWLRAAGVESNYCYCCFMAVRLIEMRRILKPTGSLFLHCDDTMAAHLKMLLDAIFGWQHFRNYIVWKRTSAHSIATKRFDRVSDHILYYSKSEKSVHYTKYLPHDEKYIKENYGYEDEKLGQHSRGDLTGGIPNPKDPTYKGYNPGERGRNWSIPRYKMEELVGKEKAAKMSTLEKLKLLDKEGYIYWSKDGVPRYKRPLADSKGKVIPDTWMDIKNVSTHAIERVGYPTQKPVKLLARIIQATTQAGDVVLDPFCGCATTCVAAEQLGRQWIGIDVSKKAYELIQMRLNREVGRKGELFTERIHYKEGLPRKADQLSARARKDLKDLLYGKQGGICTGCDHHFLKKVFELDHIVPRALGGDDNPSNLQLLCTSCNKEKGKKSMEEFMAEKQGRMVRR